MGSFSGFHWLIVLLVILIVFGAGKLPRVAGDLALGIKAFKKGMAEPEAEHAAQAQAAPAPAPAQPRTTIAAESQPAASGETVNRDRVSQG